METRLCTLVRALSYRFFGGLATASIAWALTKQARVAVSVGLLDCGLKLVVFYAHERAWNRVGYGRIKSLDQGGG